MSDLSNLEAWTEKTEKELIEAAKCAVGANGVNEEEFSMALKKVLQLGDKLRSPSRYSDEWRPG